MTYQAFWLIKAALTKDRSQTMNEQIDILSEIEQKETF